MKNIIFLHNTVKRTPVGRHLPVLPPAKLEPPCYGKGAKRLKPFQVSPSRSARRNTSKKQIFQQTKLKFLINNMLT